MTPAERFWAKVDRRGPDECWPWLATRKPGWGGQFWLEGRYVVAHRFAYELCVGPIPPGATIDHVKTRGCTEHSCCNPAHLEPVTQRENLLRGNTYQARNAAKTHCDSGHEFSPGNTKIVPSRTGTPTRECRTCRKAISRRANERRREARRLARAV